MRITILPKPIARLAGGLLLVALICPALCPPAQAKGPAVSHLIKQKVGDFPAGAAIAVCWRTVTAGNPFLAGGPFNCATTIKAVKAPFPGGAINGDQLMAVVHQGLGAAKIKEVRVRALQPGKDAADPGANLMTVSPGAGEFYNNYVGRQADGRLAVFLDLEPAP